MNETEEEITFEEPDFAPWDGRRVPVVLLGGYLGVGKTTLLNELLARTDVERCRADRVRQSQRQPGAVAQPDAADDRLAAEVGQRHGLGVGDAAGDGGLDAGQRRTAEPVLVERRGVADRQRTAAHAGEPDTAPDRCPPAGR